MIKVLILVILCLSDDVCAGRINIRTGTKFRSSISSGINRNPQLKKSSGKNFGAKPPRGNKNGYGVFLGGYHADNYKMKIMFSHASPQKISRFKIIDLDLIAKTKGEIVALTTSGFTWVKTNNYMFYGKNGEFYDDATDIYFDIYDVNYINNLTTQKNAMLKHIQVRQCLHSLRVSESNPPLLLYACYKWHQSPYVILWIPCAMLITMWLVIPVLLSVLYVKNMQGQIRSCFLYADTGRVHQYGKLEDKHEGIGIGRKRKLRLTGWVGFLAVLILSAMIVTFCLTSTDLYQEDSQDTILKIQLFRAGLTFLSIFLLALLSLFTTSLKVKLYKFPFYMMLLEKGKDLMTMKLTDDCGVVVTIFYVFLQNILGRTLSYLVLCAISLVGDLCLLVAFILLKTFHIIIFGSSGFLIEGLLSIWAKVYLKEINLKHFLYYAFLR